MGRIHVIQIKNTYLMEQVPNHILSSQHFAQAVNNHNLEPEGTGSTTNSKNITLFWGLRKYTKTILLDNRLNIGLMSMATHNEGFRAYTTKIPEEREDQIRSFISHIVPSNVEASIQPQIWFNCWLKPLMSPRKKTASKALYKKRNSKSLGSQI